MAISPPNVRTVSDHGLLIFAPNGAQVGGIIQWSPGHSQTVTPCIAFGDSVVGQGGVPVARGEPYENVPGNLTNQRIQVVRYEIDGARFLTAFGTTSLEVLSRQDDPLQLREAMAGPGGSVIWTKVYYGVWFDQVGTQMSTQGDRIVRVNASCTYAQLRELT